MTFKVIWRKSQPMIDAKVLRQALDKFLKAEIVKAARMQVRTSDGVFHDIHAIKLLENRIIGSSETHRIVIEVIPERAPMGKVIKDHGGILK